MPNVYFPTLTYEGSVFNESAFVSDCGVPSAFENVLECEHCTMCCNANEDCYPQEKTRIEKMSLDYSTLAVVLLVCCTFISIAVALSLFFIRKNSHKNEQNISSTTRERMLQDESYAMSRIGKDSIYSYFVTDMVYGWLIAFSTLAAQAGILVFFIVASEVRLQDDKIDIEFSWKCPRDLDVCSDKSDLEKAGWAMFVVLMFAFLAKDMINGLQLINHSSQIRHPFLTRVRYFVGGWGLCAITLFAVYVSTVYNKAIARSNTDIILNAVVVLFVMDMDEYIFAALEAANAKWTKHVEFTTTNANGNGADENDGYGDGIDIKEDEIEEMKDEIAVQRDQIELQRQQIVHQDQKIAAQEDKIASQEDKIELQRQQIAYQEEEIKKIAAMMQKMIALQSGAGEVVASSEFDITDTATRSTSQQLEQQQLDELGNNLEQRAEVGAALVKTHEDDLPV